MMSGRITLDAHILPTLGIRWFEILCCVTQPAKLRDNWLKVPLLPSCMYVCQYSFYVLFWLTVSCFLRNWMCSFPRFYWRESVPGYWRQVYFFCMCSHHQIHRFQIIQLSVSVEHEVGVGARHFLGLCRVVCGGVGDMSDEDVWGGVSWWLT